MLELSFKYSAHCSLSNTILLDCLVLTVKYSEHSGTWGGINSFIFNVVFNDNFVGFVVWWNSIRSYPFLCSGTS